ncbi:MAG: hypothetical protein ACLP7Q_03365 [Isosphaeraceae bacterium]
MKLQTFAVVSFVLAMPLSIPAVAEDGNDNVPKYAETESARKSADIGKWVYFVSNDPLVAVFNLNDSTGEVQYSSPDEERYVVKSMKLKYVGDDRTGLYYQYQNDVTAGGLVWFLPKAKRGYVYWMYGGTATPVISPYGQSVRFHPQ